MRRLARTPIAAAKIPPILAIKSTVDSTVTTEAVVDNLLKLLPARRNELLLFDINRHASIKSVLLIADPAPLTERMKNEDQVFLGGLAITGERGLLRLPPEWLMRMRYNPFYPYLQARVLAWLAGADSDSRASNAMPEES